MFQISRLCQVLPLSTPSLSVDITVRVILTRGLRAVTNMRDAQPCTLSRHSVNFLVPKFYVHAIDRDSPYITRWLHHPRYNSTGGKFHQQYLNIQLSYPREVAKQIRRAPISDRRIPSSWPPCPPLHPLCKRCRGHH